MIRKARGPTQRRQERHMEKVKAVRLPEWLDTLAKKMMVEVQADNFSDYIRGLVLKHARTLGVAVPPETSEGWPEWIKKPQKPPRKEPEREIEPF
jgi:ribosomal protein L13E